MRPGTLTRTVMVAAAVALVLAAVAGLVGSGLWNHAVAWVFIQQKAFHRLLVTDLQVVARDGGLWASATLIGASFAYGIVHAAGPGHGKAVISTYLLSQGDRLRRGVGMAASGALVQGLVAIALVYGVLALIGMAARQSGAAVDWSSRASFVLVGLLGLGLMLRAGRGVWQSVADRTQPQPAGSVHAHHHHQGAGAGGCGHRHVPTAEDLRRADSLPAAATVVLAMGLRPCSGAILVLVLARSLGLAWTGVGAVLAMSAGTALTVASLAVLSVVARRRAGSLAGLLGAGDSQGVALAGRVVAFVGGLVLVALGGSLLVQSFRPAHPLGL